MIGEGGGLAGRGAGQARRPARVLGPASSHFAACRPSRFRRPCRLRMAGGRGLVRRHTEQKAGAVQVSAHPQRPGQSVPANPRADSRIPRTWPAFSPPGRGLEGQSDLHTFPGRRGFTRGPARPRKRGSAPRWSSAPPALWVESQHPRQRGRPTARSSAAGSAVTGAATTSEVRRDGRGQQGPPGPAMAPAGPRRGRRPSAAGLPAALAQGLAPEPNRKTSRRCRSSATRSPRHSARLETALAIGRGQPETQQRDRPSRPSRGPSATCPTNAAPPAGSRFGGRAVAVAGSHAPTAR
jgi:hypothetical protein